MREERRRAGRDVMAIEKPLLLLALNKGDIDLRIPHAEGAFTTVLRAENIAVRDCVIFADDHTTTIVATIVPRALDEKTSL